MVTDYFLHDTYEKVLRFHDPGLSKLQIVGCSCCSVYLTVAEEEVIEARYEMVSDLWSNHDSYLKDKQRHALIN